MTTGGYRTAPVILFAGHKLVFCYVTAVNDRSSSTSVTTGTSAHFITYIGYLSNYRTFHVPTGVTYFSIIRWLTVCLDADWTLAVELSTARFLDLYRPYTRQTTKSLLFSSISSFSSRYSLRCHGDPWLPIRR